MDCDIFENIYIVWNNEQSPEDMGVFVRKQFWTKKVYFLESVENSLDAKYIVPPWANETAFLSIDDDFGISCNEMKKGFETWKGFNYGNVGPIGSFYARSFSFDIPTQSFEYVDQVYLAKNGEWKYFNLGLTGLAFVSRHILQAYYSDIAQFKKMRKMVRDHMNCEDIALNFVIGHLYPELKPLYLQGKFESFGRRGISSTAGHKEIRGQCIEKFSQLLGYNPIYLVQAAKQNSQQTVNENSFGQCLIEFKKLHLETNFMLDKTSQYQSKIKKVSGSTENVIFQEKHVTSIEVPVKEETKEQIAEPQLLNSQSSGKQIRQKDESVSEKCNLAERFYFLLFVVVLVLWVFTLMILGYVLCWKSKPRSYQQVPIGIRSSTESEQ